MFTVFIRLITAYITSVSSVRIMGKRQAGELQTGELVTALFLSELATNAVTDKRFPFLYCIFPPLILICLEVILSFLSTKITFLRKLLDSSPSILIRRGEIDISELEKNRMTAEELLSQLRLSGVFDLNTVDYAILEPNGHISVKTSGKPETGLLPRSVIIDGEVNENALREIGRDKDWLYEMIAKRGFSSPKEIFIASTDGSDSSDGTFISAKNKEDKNK